MRPKQRIPLSVVLSMLLPRQAKQGIGVLLLLMFGPTLFILLIVAVDKLFRLIPALWVLVALFVLYRLAKRLLGVGN